MKKVRVFLTAVLLVFLTGCAGSDLNSTVFVSSMGISLDGDVYSVTVFGSAADDDGVTEVSASGVGRTLSEAMNNASESCGWEIFLGHCEGIAANSAALRDTAMLSEFSDSVISPACPVYFSDSPERGAGKLTGKGFEAPLYKLSVSARNGVPAVLPTAEAPDRTAIVTSDKTILTDSEDSLGIMLLRGEAIPQTITVTAENGSEMVDISPETKRSAYYSDGVLNVEVTVGLNIGEASPEAVDSAEELIGGICRSAYEKLVVGMGIDAAGISSLTSYNTEQLMASKLILTVHR